MNEVLELIDNRPSPTMIGNQHAESDNLGWLTAN